MTIRKYPLGRKKPLLNPLLPRCRRKRQFIVTFLCPQLYDPVPRCLYRPCLCVSSKKVPTKMTFNRHLLVVSAESTFRRKSALHSFGKSIQHSFRRSRILFFHSFRRSNLVISGKIGDTGPCRGLRGFYSFRRSRIFCIFATPSEGVNRPAFAPWQQGGGCGSLTVSCASGCCCNGLIVRSQSLGGGLFEGFFGLRKVMRLCQFSDW